MDKVQLYKVKLVNCLALTISNLTHFQEKKNKLFLKDKCWINLCSKIKNYKSWFKIKEKAYIHLFLFQYPLIHISK